jgi:16S rRNA (cytosine967-C5)-methyltransferase
VTPAGDLRTLPCHWPDAEPRMAGLDGFYAARLERV